MLQQSSQHQRIGGGAHARVRSRTSSIASSSRASGLGVNTQSGLKSEVDINELPYSGSVDDDARSQWSRAGSVDEIAAAPVAIPQVGFPPRPAQYAKSRNASMWEADPQSATASSADSRSQNFEPPQVSLVYPQGSMAKSMSSFIHRILT
jgi:hypothetical protein